MCIRDSNAYVPSGTRCILSLGHGFVNTFLQLFLFFLTALVFHACARHFSQDSSRVHRRAFCPPPAQQGSVSVFLRCSSYMGILRQTLCARRVCALFRQKAVQSAKPAFFMIFLVSLLSFLCYNNLTICFNLCPCRGTGTLRRASIRRRAAGFSLQRDTTEGRSYETGKRGNS